MDDDELMAKLGVIYRGSVFCDFVLVSIYVIYCGSVFFLILSWFQYGLFWDLSFVCRRCWSLVFDLILGHFASRFCLVRLLSWFRYGLFLFLFLDVFLVLFGSFCLGFDMGHLGLFFF